MWGRTRLKQAGTVSKYSLDHIRKCFGLSSDFNEIFDAFQQALAHRVDDFEVYRQLFWNNSLKPAELCLFGEKIVREFPVLSYDVYVWLARVFEATHSSADNHELAFEYYRKAAGVRPAEADPYCSAADCYEPDLNIPPLKRLIEFLKHGAESVPSPVPVYQRLVRLYEISGNDEMTNYYRRKLPDSPPADAQPPIDPAPRQ